MNAFDEAKSLSKTERESFFKNVFESAKTRAVRAANNFTPEPMIVGHPVSTFSNEIDATKPIHFIEGGVCGFAWVNIKPGNSAFARWLVKNGLARKDDYYGGVTIWVHEFGQSLQRKEAYAHTFANALREYGLRRVYGQSRMD